MAEFWSNPKADKSKNKQATPAQKRRMDRVAALGCLICQSPAIIHHTGTHLGGGRDHDYVIPLCPRHHQYGGDGVSIHDNRASWQKIHGTEEELLEKIAILLGEKTA